MRTEVKYKMKVFMFVFVTIGTGIYISMNLITHSRISMNTTALGKQLNNSGFVIAPSQKESNLEYTINYGNIPSGLTATGRIPFFNQTQVPKKIYLFDKDCGCTSVTSSALINPGESGELILSINTSGRSSGVMERKAIFKSTTNPDIKYIVHAIVNITEPILTPQIKNIGQLIPGQRVDEIIKILPNKSWKYHSIEFYGNDPNLVDSPKPKHQEDSIYVELNAPYICGEVDWDFKVTFLNLRGEPSEVYGKFSAMVQNPLFIGSEAYIGIASRSKQNSISSLFDIIADEFSIDQLNVSDKFHVTIKRSSKDSKELYDTLEVTYEIKEDSELGLIKEYMTYINKQQNIECKIPIKVLILP